MYAEEENYLVVRNNRQRRTGTVETLPPEGSTGIGLQNIMKRYGFVSHKQVKIIEDENAFTVKLPLIQRQQVEGYGSTHH